MTKGTKSTEFWLTVLVILAGTVVVLMDKLSPEWVTMVTGAVASYSLSRGLAKKDSEVTSTESTE